MSENEKPVPAKKQTLAEMDEEMKRLELEAKRLEVLEKQANLQDVKERLAERQIAREAKGERSRVNGRTMAQNRKREEQSQAFCTHHKGGSGLAEFIGGRGQDPQYAVIKHIFLNGDMWIRCTRCGKTWKPPIREFFYFDEEGVNVPPSSDEFGAAIAPTKGKFSKEKFDAAVKEYQDAVNFQTKNTTSSSYIFRYSDNGVYSRQILAHTNLR